MGSNTPRTDLAAIYAPIRGNYICAPGTGSYVGVEFARQLERELNEQVRLNKHLRFEANGNLEALHEAQRALKSACPDGYVVVPKEPTEAM